MADVSRVDNYRRGELLGCMDGRANTLMDRKVVGVVHFGGLQWSTHPQLLNVVWRGVVWRSVVVVVVVVAV